MAFRSKSTASSLLIFASCSPTIVSMFQGPRMHLHRFVITCKGCRQNIPAPVQTMPDTWIIAECSLCGEKRRYLPAEIFQGRAIPSA
jgi:hypothetical protein